jgi:hypothetical protein
MWPAGLNKIRRRLHHSLHTSAIRRKNPRKIRRRKSSLARNAAKKRRKEDNSRAPSLKEEAKTMAKKQLL